MAFYLAGEITQVKESRPWVRCASGNVYTIVHLTQSPFEELSNSDPDTVYLFVYSPYNVRLTLVFAIGRLFNCVKLCWIEVLNC